MTYSETDKLICIERELKFRRRVYPRQIEIGKMTISEAQKQITIMEEIVEDYRKRAATEKLL